MEKPKKAITAGLIMILGLILLKYIPMNLFGQGILFDASAHVVTTMFIFYVLWILIRENKKLKTPYFILAIVALLIVSIQRIIVNAHNESGIILGLIVSLISILISEKLNEN